MEKYNISTFKNVLSGDLADQEVAALWADPAFEQEFSFYLQMRQGGQQLIEKHTSAKTAVVKPLFSKFALAASVVLASLGGYVFIKFSNTMTMMGDSQPSFVAQHSTTIGISLLVAAVGVFYFFRKK